MGSRIIIPK